MTVSVAHAANCSVATAQGTTGPSDWQTYCWIDFSSYNDTTARSSSGQAFSLTLQDGTVLNFTLKTSGTALTATGSPSWSGAAIGNTAMTGIAGSPVLYQTGAGTTTVTVSSIRMTPPAGAGGVTSYMLVAADGESTNSGETLRFTTNGGAWQTLGQAGAVSGSSYPSLSGAGTTSVTETGATANYTGAYIFGSSTPTQIGSTLVGGGLEGFMLAVRYASVRLTMAISGARVSSSDQFTYAITATSNGATLVSGTSSGTGLGPFTTAGVSAAASVPLTLTETMASGSTNSLSHYVTTLTCTNSNGGSSTSLPSGLATTSYAIPSLSFGDALQCTFTETPYPHLTLQKALGSGGRQYSTDQFTMNIAQGSTVVATTTTRGTGSTLTNPATAQTQVSAGTAYTLDESTAGTTVASQYTSVLGWTNANGSSSTKLPTAPGGSITPALGDVVSCTITNTKVATNASLAVVKSSTVLSDPVNGSTNPKAIPGAIVAYTITVSNTGPSAVDKNTVLLIDALPSQLSVGTAASPTFVQGSPSSNLTFSAASNIAFSSSTIAPTSFAACTYTPTTSYDPAVRFICLNPRGTMAGSTGTPPSFAITLQARVN
ncbi:CshA/CshB family fibrillar adhesin-related protein [Novosphingobium nitrogenifigens]|uniref:CshA/CshB family fibrillar adhesin-related protein n=1 Tax=Novosphingobium nitrogenifigens TaxID=378548 RepID=UPI0003172EBA|nr:CshA/CshB family fibrillar adhesin-related protein [Novosphingobium nitrogenifigens]